MHTALPRLPSPLLFSLYFWVMGMKLLKGGQREDAHRTSTAQGFTPALQAPSPAELVWLSLTGTIMSRQGIAQVNNCSNSFRGTYFPSSTRFDSDPSQCHTGERLKDTKPSGSPGTKEACKHSLASSPCWLQGLHARMLKWRTLAVYSSKC